MVKEETSNPTAIASILVAVKDDRTLDGDDHPKTPPGQLTIPPSFPS